MTPDPESCHQSLPAAQNAEPLRNETGISLAVLRWGVAFAILMSAAAMVAINLLRGNPPTETALELGVLLFAGSMVEWMLKRAEQRLRLQREQMRRMWLSQQAELQDIASRDDLTQLQNRRFFYQRLQEELDQAIKHKRPLSILMLDVDDLKAINDEFGHQVGDAVLRSFGRILNSHAREGWVTARLGGDEFAVIMPGADRREAEAVAWRLWEDMSKSPAYETGHASIYLGVSVGSSGYPWGGNDLEEIIHWADTKLYANKLERKGFKHGPDNGKDTRLVSAVVDVLSTALDVRDRMTHRHARRVARMAAVIAREMNLSEQEVLEIEYAAALHDIGKIGVADSILRKVEPLDEDEWREMRRHCELGYQILNGIDFLRDAAEIVYSHHEKWDGTGYPRGLMGPEIPLGARVFAVVDAYDAMTSRRPYRDAMSREDALREVARHAGTQFDPRVVEAFLRVIRKNPEGFPHDDGEYGARVEGSEPVPLEFRRAKRPDGAYAAPWKR
jgi:diguanylate cyclase (GGDEF)-like protein